MLSKIIQEMIQENKRLVNSLGQAAKHALSWKGRIEILAY